jgi:hypothetical protein
LNKRRERGKDQPEGMKGEKNSLEQNERKPEPRKRKMKKEQN